MKPNFMIAMSFLFALSAGAAFADDIAKELPEAVDIMKKFDSMPYVSTGEKVEAAGEVAFCSSIVKRKQQENLALLQAALKDRPAIAALLRDLDFKGTPTRTVERAVNEDGKRPVFFFSDTVVHILAKNGGTYQDRFATLKEIKPGDFVLSTTAHVIDDVRYHQRCWAFVTAKTESKLPAQAPMGVIIYQNKAGETQNLLSTLDPKLSLYARVNGEQGDTWAPVACKDLKLGAELFSPKDEGLEGRCQFAATFRPQSHKDLEAMNLDVELTGAYFVGPLGAQILVQN